MEFLVDPITVVGYHGTSKEFANKIIADGFQPSQESWDWLGNGVYFWQDAPLRAYAWAEARYPEPCVVATRITLARFVDLLDLAGMQTLKGIAKDYQGQAQASDLKNYKGANKLDCAVFNLTTSMLSLWNVQVAGYRAACVEGEPLTEGSPIHDKSHVQIVVLNQEAILEKWIVESREEG